MRRGRDSNPRSPFGAYALSRRAPSTTRPPLLLKITAKIRNYFHTIYNSVSSPRRFFSRNFLTHLLSEYWPNKKNNFATAASVVQSLPPVTPAFLSALPVEYVSISTRPAWHWVMLRTISPLSTASLMQSVNHLPDGAFPEP